jgi:hypothetical protein
VWNSPPPEVDVTRPGVDRETPAEVTEATRAEVSIDDGDALRAAHSSPLPKVPVCIIVTEPGLSTMAL